MIPAGELGKQTLAVGRDVTQTVSLRLETRRHRLVMRDPQTDSLRTVSPAMISRMAGLDGDERSATGGADFIVGNQFAFYHRPIT